MHWGRLITCPNGWFPTPMPSTAAVPPARALPDCPPDRRVREGCCRTVRPVVGGGAGAPLPYALSQVRVGRAAEMVARLPGAGEHWGGQRVIGTGNGALGQVDNLPQWVVSYPNSSLRSRAASARPTPMGGFLPQCGSRRPGGALCRRGGARFHRDTSAFTAMPHFASVITLAK